MQPVQRFYDEHVQYEWNRLERHRMEFAINMRMLAEYLPAPPCRLLDVGGGPGRYAIALSQKGYQVSLLDLSANNLALAREKAAESDVTLADVVHGNALDLSAFGAESFDAVLLMGPLYHLLETDARRLALREAHRVLRPGGVLAAAFINRYATMRVHQADWVLAHESEIRQELQTGVRRGADGGFTDAYSAHPTEVQPLLEGSGFTLLGMVASEGLRSDVDGPVNHLRGEEWERWIELNYRIGQDPAVHGSSIHLLAMASRAG